MKTLLTLIIVFLLIGGSLDAFSQPNKRTNFWFWADELGLDFNSGSPVENTSCPFGGQGWGATATMCDTNGNLLFYSMGDSVYNSNHHASMNSVGCYAWKQGAQSAISLPVPGSDSLFYIFTARMHRYPNPMFYYIVDMSLNNGLGEIIDIDTLAAGYDAADQIQAVYLKNKEDYWIITRKYHEDKFAAFLVTSEGVNPQPVLSPAPNKDYLGSDRMGFMKVSYDKKYLVACFRPDVELYKFDVKTGSIEYLSKFRLRDIVFPNNPAYTTYNCEFSPCSKFMYLGGTLYADSNTHVFQMDMQYIEDSVTFEQSIIEVGDGQGRHLQLASDGKIYLFFRHAAFQPPNPINEYVGVIHDPGKHGLACNHQPNAFVFSQGNVCSAFVNFAVDFLFRFDFDGICESDTFAFDPWFFPDPVSIEWNFDDPASGFNNISGIPHATHKFSDGGEYEVSVRVEYPSGRIEETSRMVEVEYAPEPDLGPDTTFCSTSGIILDAECGPHMYVWSTGAFGVSQITVTDTGWYWVQVTDDAGCFETDSIHLSAYPPAIADTTNLEIIPTTCGGSTGVIKGLVVSGIPPVSYQWLDDMGNPVSNSLDIYHLPVGNYTLEVTDGNSCITPFGPYSIYDAGDVLIEKVEYTQEHCSQQDATITVIAVSGLGEMLFYSLDNGVTYYNNQGLFTGISAGSYAVRVKDSTNCECAYINNPVIVQNTESPEITDITIGPCATGQSNGFIELSAIGGGDTIFYSNDNGLNFQVNDGGFYGLVHGFYTCVVMDEVGCDTTFVVEVPEELTIRLQAVAGDDEVCPGNAAFVPLSVSSFNDVAYFKTTLIYNKSLLICNGFSNTHPALEDSLEVMLFPAEGKVELSWHAAPLSLPDNTIMTDLVFQSLDPGLSFVSWDGSAGASLFLNSSGLTIPVDYFVGSIKIYKEVFFVLGPDLEVCQGDDINITPIVFSSNGDVSYLWTDPAGITSQDEILSIYNVQQNQSGTYSLRVTDTLNCYADNSVGLLVHPSPVPAISAQDTIVTEDPIQLDAGSNYVSYQWNTGDTTQYILADYEAWYTVIIESQPGCIGEDSVYVLFWADPHPPEPISNHFYLPNAFTPDGDGLNDEFMPVGSTDNITSFKMQIYNRWGQLLFESSDITSGWDGSYNSEILQGGSYVYKIVYAIGRNDFTKTGTVIVVR